MCFSQPATHLRKQSEKQYKDITQNNNFYLQQRLAYFTYKRDGDVFATLPLLRNEINLRLIPPEFLTHDSVDGFIQGIKTNQYGRPVEYAINKSEDALDDFIILRNSINKQNVLHLSDPERINSLRGMPFTKEIIRDLVYIDDVVSAFLVVLDKYHLIEGELLEVGSGISINLKQAVFNLLSVLNSKMTHVTSKTNVVFDSQNKDQLCQSVADISPLKKLGWMPVVSLASGFEKTVEIAVRDAISRRYSI